MENSQVRWCLDQLWFVSFVDFMIKINSLFCVVGPLLYHFEDIPNETSFELSYEDLRAVILSYGFQIEVLF